jgi:hypothetical protein
MLEFFELLKAVNLIPKAVCNFEWHEFDEIPNYTEFLNVTKVKTPVLHISRLPYNGAKAPKLN